MKKIGIWNGEREDQFSLKLTLIACAVVAASLASATPFQRGGGGGGHSGGGGGGSSHGGGGGGHQSSPTPQPSHARREVVQTSHYVPRTSPQNTPQPSQGSPNNFQGQRQQPQNNSARPQNFGNISAPARIGNGTRPTFDHSNKAANERQFTHTSTGRQYDNGLMLHKGVKVSADWQRHYFPKGSYHFRFYRRDFRRGSSYISPFGFYFGICDPFIAITDCNYYPPADDYINAPIYSGNNFQGWSENDDNQFDRPDLEQAEPGLLNATDEITETFQNADIDALVALVDPSVSIAIYQQGKYQYSMPSNDYVDLTRDALSSIKNNQFALNYLHQDSPNAFTASGKQSYIGADGSTRTVYLSFALQDISGHWTLTQVETNPDRVQSFNP